MREAFLAVDVSLEMVERIVMVQEDLSPLVKERGGRSRWVSAPNIHLTLKSIGEVDEALLVDICEVVEKLASSLVPFKVSVKGLGFFPSMQMPRVLCSRVDQGLELVERLQKVLDNRLLSIGIAKDERPFEAMLHIGRVLTPDGSIDLSDLEGTDEVDFGHTYIKSIMLVQTELSKKGPGERTYRRFVLGK
jgi:2'-5' RNA ligase